MDVVQKMKPLCSDHRQLQSLVKEEIPSFLAANEGEGKNAPQVRRKQRMDRVEARVKKVYNEIEAIRNEKRENKIFLCPERHPETKSYCTCEFLSKAGLDRHILKNLHKFPVGVNARDRAILQNNRLGGCLAIGR